jgi:hypothetical protein
MLTASSTASYSATRALARIIGPFLLIMAAALILRSPMMPAAAGAVIGEPGLELLLGVFTLILGLIMVAFHNRWAGFGQVMVSLLAWLTAIRGAALLLIPDVIRALALQVLDQPLVYLLAGAGFVALGAIYVWIGFLAKDHAA